MRPTITESELNTSRAPGFPFEGFPPKSPVPSQNFSDRNRQTQRKESEQRLGWEIRTTHDVCAVCRASLDKIGAAADRLCHLYCDACMVRHKRSAQSSLVSLNLLYVCMDCDRKFKIYQNLKFTKNVHTPHSSILLYYISLY